MPQDRYRLNDLARAELDDLRRAGHAPTDDDVIEINALAEDVLTPDTRRALARGRPVECGGAWFWPLTISSSAWFSEIGCDMPDPTAALAFAAAHSSDDRIHEADWPAVRRWYRGLRCRPSALSLALSAIIAQDEETEIPHRDGERGMKAGELSSAMVATAGGDPAMWERQVSIGYIRAVLNTLAAQNKPSGVPPAVARATMALGMACEKIRNRERDDG